MRTAALVSCLLVLAGCAGSDVAGGRDMAPYKAVVVFEWLRGEDEEDAGSRGAPSPPEEPPGPAGAAGAGGEENADPAGADGEESSPAGPVPHGWVEGQIIRGLEEHDVFSDFVVTDWEDMYLVAEQRDADLILLIRIGSLARWRRQDVRVDPALAAVNFVLWIVTAIGGWWIDDQVFTTESDIEVYWRRPPQELDDSLEWPRKPSRPADLRPHFRERDRESISSGREYGLSLWDRAKIWKTPGAYLANVLLPGSFVPFYDDAEVRRSLVEEALVDINREIARRLRGANLRSGGAPFFFRIERPDNGAEIDGSSVRLAYRYRLEPGFEEHAEKPLQTLRIELKRDGDESYRTLREYRDDAIRSINDKIESAAEIEERIEGLGPGLNLIRFSAETERKRQWITNTIALIAP